MYPLIDVFEVEADHISSVPRMKKGEKNQFINNFQTYNEFSKQKHKNICVFVYSFKSVYFPISVRSLNWCSGNLVFENCLNIWLSNMPLF